MNNLSVNSFHVYNPLNLTCRSNFLFCLFINCSCISNWVSEYKRGQMSVEDGQRSGGPITATTPEIIE